MAIGKMISVSSAAVAALGFTFYPGKSKKTDKGDMRVRYKGGRTYKYSGVPMTEFLKLLEAGSIGRQISRIKKKYSCTKV